MCDCSVCTYFKKFLEKLQFTPEKDREFWNDLYDNFCSAEMDRDYYKAIVENKWPDGDKILAKYRKE